MQRGDVFWFEPDPARGSEQAGHRPAIIISRDAINRVSPVIIVVPLTTYRGQTLYPSDVLIHAPEGGLSQDSVAMGLHIRAIDKQRLGAKLGHISDATMTQMERAILQVLYILPGFS
jgi:mRNA interferase MazF